MSKQSLTGLHQIERLKQVFQVAMVNKLDRRGGRTKIKYTSYCPHVSLKFPLNALKVSVKTRPTRPTSIGSSSDDSELQNKDVLTSPRCQFQMRLSKKDIERVSIDKQRQVSRDFLSHVSDEILFIVTTLINFRIVSRILGRLPNFYVYTQIYLYLGLSPTMSIVNVTLA